jgi:cathepsin B
MAWFYSGLRGIVSGGPYNSHQGCQPYTLSPCAHYSNGTADLPDCFKNSKVHNPKCTNKCISEYKIPFKKDKHFNENHYSVQNNVRQIQLEIFHNGPVQSQMIAYDDFLFYKSGVYQHVKGNSNGNHAVKIIGWGIENGVDYWLVANSWNKFWVNII